MRNLRQRFIHHAQAVLPEGHAVIGIFVIRGGKLGAEPAKLMKCPSWRYQEDRRAVINRAAKVVLRQLRVVPSSISQSAPVRPNDRACLLQLPVCQQDLSSYSTDAVMFEILQHSRDCTSCQERIVIEEAKIFSGCDIGSLHTCRSEPKIGLITDDLGSLEPFQHRQSRVG